MKNLSIFLLIVVFLTSGCSFNMEVLTPVSAGPSPMAAAPSQNETPPATQNAEPLAASNCYDSPEAHGYAMLTTEFRVDVYGERRMVLDDLHGNLTELYVGNYLPYYHSSPDNKYILFVDRDCSQQSPSTTIGIRDSLWTVEIPSGRLQLLYSSNTNFTGYAGPVISPDGRFIASLEGTGFGDACLMDSRLIFFELASDHQSVKPITQEQFLGFPIYNDGFVYPVEDGEWETGNLYLVTLDGTCNVDKTQMGPYLFDLTNMTTEKSSSVAAPLIPGDLGWGKIHGRIIDAATGAPIAGAIVTCSHSSYTSPVTCSGSTTTNADGIYIFGNVFFHDTDTIHLNFEAERYQTQEITQSAFTMADMETDIAMTRTP